jgi:ankyrin repeat protein
LYFCGEKIFQIPSWAETAKNGGKIRHIWRHLSPLTLNYRDNNGGTPLSWAAANGDEGIVKLLLEAKPDVNLKDNKGRTPLSWAAANGDEGVVKLLLEAKPNFNLQDNKGRMPLSWAAAKRHKGTIKLLLEAKSQCQTRRTTIVGHRYRGQ